MSEVRKSRLKGGELFFDRVLSVAPWIAFLIVALPAPLFFLLRSFSGVDEPGVYVLLALTSLALGSAIGLIVALALVLYRRARLKRVRDRLAIDGITADEISLFAPELTRAERKTLRQVEGQSALLADAYRETLAARLTADRVIKRAERELLTVKRREQQSNSLAAAQAAALRKELSDDRDKLSEIIRNGRTRRAEVEVQLHTIAAAAGRGATEADLAVALGRLQSPNDRATDALEIARSQQEALREAERELRALETGNHSNS